MTEDAKKRLAAIESLKMAARDLDKKIKNLGGRAAAAPRSACEKTGLALDAVALFLDREDPADDLAGLDRLPVLHADRGLAAHLPVEELVPLLGLAQEGGQHRDPVNAFGRTQTGQLGQGRQDVPEGEDLVADPARRDLPRPPRDEGNPDAPLVQRPFACKQGRIVRPPAIAGVARSPNISCRRSAISGPAPE